MKNLWVALTIALIALFLLVGVYGWRTQVVGRHVTKAIAVVHPTDGNSMVAVVRFIEHKDGIVVQAGARNLTPGKHGFHVHQLGDCSCPDASCAAGHFNPTNSPHGGPDSPERHVGDLGNLEADANGVADYEYIDPVLSLNGPDSIIGRSVIVHADADDLTTQPTGNSGARIGCGVIGIAVEVDQ